MINEVTLGQNDILVFHVDVGTMSPARIQLYLEELKLKLRGNGIVSADQKMLFLPKIREAGSSDRGTDITILHQV